MTTPASYVAAFGRLLIAAIFLFSGVGKILAPAIQVFAFGAGGFSIDGRHGIATSPTETPPPSLGGNLTAGSRQ
jgi:hypothetical protein